MDIQKERKAFEALYKPCDRIAFCFGLKKYVQLSNEDNDSEIVDHANQCWELWQAAKAQAIPEGFVLVLRDQVTNFWQDADEPENFVINESDFDCLGDCIDLGEIIEINKHAQAHIKTEKLYGTWFADALFPSEKANFHVGTQEECNEIIAKNKAMIEAQEQGHE